LFQGRSYGSETYSGQEQLRRGLRNQLALWLAVKTGETAIVLLAVSTNWDLK
jgi:hypothetical protein